uniref:Uncharacterized protein n=1 Tax=Arion vulgaris TaxID=1028688 RepID=A0A0B7B7F8_9EUPU
MHKTIILFKTCANQTIKWEEFCAQTYSDSSIQKCLWFHKDMNGTTHRGSIPDFQDQDLQTS